MLLIATDITVEFAATGGRKVHAVSGISLDVAVGETLGLVGESGCGKTTVGRSLLHLPPPTSGNVTFAGVDLSSLDHESLRHTRTDMQMIFQDPISSLNPRRQIGQIVAEPLKVWGPRHKSEQDRLVKDALQSVGLDASWSSRRPYQLSGGQCQRVSIARALILSPKLLICDEAVSALDVSIQAQILNLLEDLKSVYSLTLVFIAHDLAVVKSISDRIAVMYAGKLCEVCDSDDFYSYAAHPYSRLLLRSSPIPDPEAPVDTSPVSTVELPSTHEPPSGCRFRTRCARADERCAREEPTMRAVDVDHYVACHHPHVGAIEA
jgi:peptide/nickel transport system ATP-binding protein